MMDRLISDPWQKLMIATWMMALHDINQGYLLKNRVFQFDEFHLKGVEIVNNFWDAYLWFRKCDGTFHLIAGVFDMEVDTLRDKTLKLIEQSREKIDKRSKLTNKCIYATISRFRNYDKETPSY